MGEIESEQFHNTFEIEVSNLDEPEIAANSSRPSLLFRKPRFSPRQRRLYLILLNGLVLLVLVLLLASTASVRGLVGSVFFHPTPTPTPTLVPGVDLFYVRADPPWGHLLIDGHPIALPAIGTDPPLHLIRGQHQLVWQADPFLAQRCTVSVPLNFADTCSDHETAQASSGLSAWVITFSEALSTLAGTPRAALLQAAQAALDARQSTETVQPGEHYVLAANNPACSRNGTQGYQCYATAKQPLRATLSFQLDMNESSNGACIDPQPGNCTWNDQDCRLFCGGSFPAPSSTREWDVLAPVLSLWTFATMDGQVLARDVPDDSAQDYATGQTLDESLVQLHITWDSLGWHVALSANLDSQDSPNTGYFDPVCAAMTQQVVTLNPPAVNGAPMYLQWQFASGTSPASGCVAVGTSQPEGLTTTTPTPSPQPTFYYLHRFGVLLAVNQLAQSTGLLLPLADAYEQHLAQRLIEGTSRQLAG